MTMTLADALDLADHASPMPHLAGEALRVLRAELERRPAVPPEARGLVESIAALLHEEATDEPWTVAGIEHDGPDRTYYRELARKVVNLTAAQQQLPAVAWHAEHADGFVAVLKADSVDSGVFYQALADGVRMRPLIFGDTALPPSEQSDAWREGWARAYAGSDLYTDDGELQDSRMQPFIDFRRDSAETIRQKIVERAQQGQAARKMKGGTHG
jgi:hypothetical protein